MVAVNMILVPRIGYMACAWGGLAGYGTCVLLSYFIGQRHYRVPYPVGNILGWFGIALGLYALSFCVHFDNLRVRMGYNTLLLLVYVAVIGWSERAVVKRAWGVVHSRLLKKIL
jgi:O-antigen/teichoic acid export membrane protein